VLGIENHDRLSASALAEIVDRISSPAVGICLDTANSFGALEGPQWVVQTLGPYVVNLHLKDFTIRREPHMMGFRIEGAPAGQGLLDVPWVLDQLRAFGRDVNVILELWPPPEPDVAATIAKEAMWRAASIRYLRTLIPD
jgi:sugar phosphate isomerase/epimerase